jgi:uncharacterized protein (DUF2147 family)
LKNSNCRLLVACLAASLLCFFSLRAYAQNAPCIAGTWVNDDATARILIYPAKGGQYAGKVIWLKEPNYHGKPKTDYRNPDQKLRNRPIIGLVVLKGFKGDSGTTFDGGTIYDPKNGKTYDCKITCRDGGKTLSIRGYIGISMIGRSTTWSRLP